MLGIETPELIGAVMAVRNGATLAEAASELGPWGMVGGFAVGVGVYAADKHYHGAISKFFNDKLGICVPG